MDDFVILAKIEKELEECTIRFLKIAEKHNLCFKQSKCDFNTTEIPTLGRSTNRRRKSQSDQGMKNTNKSKGCRKLLRLCKLLLTIHQRFQPHCSTIKSTKRKRRMEMDKRKTKDNHATSTGPTQKRRKIQGRSRCIRTHN